MAICLRWFKSSSAQKFPNLPRIIPAPLKNTRYGDKESKFLLDPLFLWDCSSIGQSTALSRRKLRVRAPSVPTDTLNTSINLKGGGGQNCIPPPKERSLFFVVRDGRINKIFSSIIVSIPRNAGSFFSIVRDPWNRILYIFFLEKGTHTQMEFTIKNEFKKIPLRERELEDFSRLKNFSLWPWFYIT